MNDIKEDPKDALRSMATIEMEENQDFISPKTALFRNLNINHHTILAGPPGTGKTKLVLDIKDALKSNNQLGIHRMVQFHPQYSYQDFIDGYEPTQNGFKQKKGVFRQFLEDVKNRRKETQDKIDLFLIDEINRADISSVFGELLTLLDDPNRKKIKTARSDEPLELYESIVIVATMNTADKNIALMDFALRRRFSFVFVPPDYDGMIAWLNKFGFGFEEFSITDYVKAARNLNFRISSHPLLGKRMEIGQALFVPKKLAIEPFTLEEITASLSEQVLPQLEAYLGFGAIAELDGLISPHIRRKIEIGKQISEEDVVSLIRVLITTQNENNPNK